MWLLTTLIAALLATLLNTHSKGKYKLGFLSLMLWGATIMILVDHIVGYEGETFLETETEGLITNATLLGFIMLIPILLIWSISLFTAKKTKSASP